MAVTVRSSTAKSEPSRRPSRIVRVISRLRRLDCVDLQGRGTAIGLQVIDVLQRGLLRLVEVIDHRPRGPQGLVVARIVGEAEAFQVVGAKVLEQGSAGRFPARRPSRAAA